MVAVAMVAVTEVVQMVVVVMVGENFGRVETAGQVKAVVEMGVDEKAEEEGMVVKATVEEVLVEMVMEGEGLVVG